MSSEKEFLQRQLKFIEESIALLKLMPQNKVVKQQLSEAKKRHTTIKEMILTGNIVPIYKPVE